MFIPHQCPAYSGWPERRLPVPERKRKRAAALRGSAYGRGAYGGMADEDGSRFNRQGGGLNVAHKFRRAFQFTRSVTVTLPMTLPWMMTDLVLISARMTAFWPTERTPSEEMSPSTVPSISRSSEKRRERRLPRRNPARCVSIAGRGWWERMIRERKRGAAGSGASCPLAMSIQLGKVPRFVALGGGDGSE